LLLQGHCCFISNKKAPFASSISDTFFFSFSGCAYLTPFFIRHRLLVSAPMDLNIFFAILIYLLRIIILLSNTACKDFAIDLCVKDILCRAFYCATGKIFLGGLIQQLYLSVASIFEWSFAALNLIWKIVLGLSLIFCCWIFLAR